MSVQRLLYTKIKQHIGTPGVHMLIVMTTKHVKKHVLVPQRPHNFIVNVQPSFPTTAASILVQHVDTIVPTVSGLSVVVKHSIELVVHQLRGFLGIGCHDFWADRATNDS